MLNNFVAVGRLTKDPELRKANNDTSICNVVIAIDNSLKEADGTRGTLFLDAKTFGNKADNIVKYCRKGSKVAVRGSLNQREFIRQDGSKGKVIELVIDDVEFFDSKPVDSNAPKFDEVQKAEQTEAELDLPDDDIPFKEEETKPQEKVKPSKNPVPKFDPYTGKPLKPKAKK